RKPITSAVIISARRRRRKHPRRPMAAATETLPARPLAEMNGCLWVSVNRPLPAPIPLLPLTHAHIEPHAVRQLPHHRQLKRPDCLNGFKVSFVLRDYNRSNRPGGQRNQYIIHQAVSAGHRITLRFLKPTQHLACVFVDRNRGS